MTKVPPPHEILPRRRSATSVLLPTCAVFGSATVPAHAGFERVALAFVCLCQLFQSPPAKGRQLGPERRGEAVVFSRLFQLCPPRGPESRPATEHREQSAGRSQRPFRFSPTLSLFHLTLFLSHRILSLFRLTLFRVRPASFSVQQVVLQRLNPVFGQVRARARRLKRSRSFSTARQLFAAKLRNLAKRGAN